MRKIISLILVLAMLVSVIPTVFAGGSDDGIETSLRYLGERTIEFEGGPANFNVGVNLKNLNPEASNELRIRLVDPNTSQEIGKRQFPLQYGLKEIEVVANFSLYLYESVDVIPIVYVIVNGEEKVQRAYFNDIIHLVKTGYVPPEPIIVDYDGMTITQSGNIAKISVPVTLNDLQIGQKYKLIYTIKSKETGKDLDVKTPFTFTAEHTESIVTLHFSVNVSSPVNAYLNLTLYKGEEVVGLHNSIESPFPIVNTDPCSQYTDVKRDAWYHEAIDYAIVHKLFNGTSETTMSPEANMTRAMLVTVLWRWNNSPEVNGPVPFKDAKTSAYYYKALVWAVKNNVINGTSPTTFSPDDPITREQLVTILYRLFKIEGKESTDISMFKDAGKISNYARKATEWAYSVGLITGTSPTTLDPQGHATRAQVATMLMRYSKWLEDSEKQQ